MRMAPFVSADGRLRRHGQDDRQGLETGLANPGQWPRSDRSAGAEPGARAARDGRDRAELSARVLQWRPHRRRLSPDRRRRGEVATNLPPNASPAPVASTGVTDAARWMRCSPGAASAVGAVLKRDDARAEPEAMLDHRPGEASPGDREVVEARQADVGRGDRRGDHRPCEREWPELRR